MILTEALAAYALAGGAAAVAFILFGVSRVLPHASLSPVARLLLLPGAVVFWPFLLGRWLTSGRSR